MNSWIKVSLQQVCSLVTDGTHHSPPNFPTGAYRYVTAKNIRQWGLDLSDISYVDEQTHKEIYSRCPVEHGDVLYIKDGVTTGLAAINTLAEPFSMLSSVALLKPTRDVLHPPYLKHWLNSPLTKRDMTSGMTGTAIKRLVLKQIRAAEIPLAPLNEQRRIADKLDTVLTRVDAVSARLARVAPLLKRFRQSVLAAATSGRLTEDWRTGRSPDWDQALFADVVVESSTGLVRSATEQFPLQEGLAPYLKMNSVGEMWGYECTDLPGVNCSVEEFKRYELRQGDWLFNTRNSVELVGKSCVWNGPAGVVFNNNLLRVRFHADINPMWVEIFFRSPKGRDLLAAVKSATTSVAAIYQRSLMGLPMLRPPADEQTEIVRRVEVLFAFADRLEARLKAAQTATERLTPALLAKAFRGELVPQDPNDEPASELLRRLQAASGHPAPARASGRGRKRSA